MLATVRDSITFYAGLSLQTIRNLRTETTVSDTSMISPVPDRCFQTVLAFIVLIINAANLSVSLEQVDDGFCTSLRIGAPRGPVGLHVPRSLYCHGLYDHAAILYMTLS